MPVLQVRSGAFVDYEALKVDDVNFDDIAHSLGQTVRFNGHTERPITVAEHSLRVSRIAGFMAERERPGDSSWFGLACIAGLHHDDHEAYTPWGDCLAMGKTPTMRVLEDRLDGIISQRLGWHSGFGDAAKRLVKQADAAALYFEAMLWKREGSAWAPPVWRDSGDTELVNALRPLARPRIDETLGHALTTGTWVGAAWLREVQRVWFTDWGPVPYSEYLVPA